jgi:hypothetical protein
MNRKQLLFLLLIPFCQGVHAQTLENVFPKALSLTVTNPSDKKKESALVFISNEQLAKLDKNFNAKAFVIMVDGKEIASQYNYGDADYAGVVFVMDSMNARKSYNVTIRHNPSGSITRNYVKRTQAELSHKVGGKFENREYLGGEFKNVDFLRVPVEHKDHSWFIRYEGPGWESDKVGYRFYLDWRNATDVFGKTTSAMVLQHVGLDGFDSYHEKQPWGMDVMKVGKSLGLGSLGIFTNGHAVRVEKTDSSDCRVTENGVVFSSLLTNYYGWHVDAAKFNLKSRLTIHAGSRLTHQLITITGNPENLCTGIVKDKAAKLFTSKGDAQHFGYIATYGKQSLNNDNLGLVVFFRSNDHLAFAEDEFSNVVTLKPVHGNLEYYFLAAWEGEEQGIKDELQFINYITEVSQTLANPLVIQQAKAKNRK